MPSSNLQLKAKITSRSQIQADQFKELKEWKRHIFACSDGQESNSSLISLLLFVATKQVDDLVTTEEEETLYATMLDLFKITNQLSTQMCFASFDKEVFYKSLPLLKQVEKHLPASLAKHNTLVGDTYQIWASLERKQVLQQMERADKVISKDELIAFTQIYTPEWVVDFLIEQTLGKFANSKKPVQELKILDPACGSGHFLLRAFDYLLRYYAANSINRSMAETVDHILSKQLFGADIDSRSLFTAALHFAVRCKSLNIVPKEKLHNLELLHLDKTEQLGSVSKDLPPDSILQNKYDIVLTNPPYIGRKLISREMKTRLKHYYPEAFSDLSSAFVRRSLDFLEQNGKFGVITQASILSLPTYKKLRRYLLENFAIDLIVDLGPGVFPTQSGEKINSALLIISNPDNNLDSDIKVIDAKGSDKKENPKEYQVAKSTIKELYNYSFNYQIPEELAQAAIKAEKLGDLVDIRQGLATTDNKRFLRYIWQIDKNQLNQKWFAYAKGAGNNKWYSPIIHVVDWQDNGFRIKESARKKYPYLNGKVAWVVKNENYYFRKGLSFSFVNTKGMALRRLPEGCIFDVGASSVFTDSLDHGFLCGYLNSALINAFMCSINPTINNQVGDLKRIPLPISSINDDTREQIASLAEQCYELSRSIYQISNPASFYLCHPDDIDDTTFNTELTFDSYLHALKSKKNCLIECEDAIDKIVFKIFEENERWDKSTTKTIKEWANNHKITRFKDENCLQDYKLKIQYVSMIIVQEYLNNGSIRKSCQSKVESVLQKQFDSFLKNEFKSFINSAFCKTIPENLVALIQ